MSEYGIQPTGFVRKPLSVVLAEIENLMISQFGPGVIQTPQSPLGQLNGLFSDMVNELWEDAESLYQSYDPEQAEGNRLDTLGRIRLIRRGDDTDAEFRKAIMNEGQARIDVQDISKAVGGLDGVTFHHVFVNETAEIDNYGLERGTIAIAVIGGNDQAIAETLRKYVTPGINTYGNHRVTSEIDGFCRSMSIIRPIPVPIELQVNVRTFSDRQGCPPPSVVAIANGIIEDWDNIRINGLDLTFYQLRQMVESRFTNVEVVNFIANRDGNTFEAPNQPLDISFIEIGELTDETVTISVV